MRNRFRLYRLFLKLYPRSFQREYSQQMLQTLDDMLNDQPDTPSRILVWLRVSAELPLSIGQETITSLGETSMEKLSLTNNKRLIFGATIIILLASVFIFKGWIQNTVVPFGTGVFYKHGVQTKLQDQHKAIGSPFQTLSHTNPQPRTDCSTLYSQAYKTLVSCTSVAAADIAISPTNHDKPKLIDAAKAIEARLKHENYELSSTNNITLSTLIAAAFEGKGDTNAVIYHKTTDNNICVLSASFNVKVHTVSQQLACNRNINVLGQPRMPQFN